MNIQHAHIRTQRARQHFVKLYRPLHDALLPIGWALTHHGSLSRDLDFTAIPWVSPLSTPKEAFEKVMELCLKLNGFAVLTPGKENQFPRRMRYGRLQWSIWLDDLVYIDFSVVPPPEPEWACLASSDSHG